MSASAVLQPTPVEPVSASSTETLSTLAATYLPDVERQHPEMTALEQRVWAKGLARRAAKDYSREPTATQLEQEARLEAAQHAPVLWEELHASRCSFDGEMDCQECGGRLGGRCWLTTDLLVVPATGGCYEWFRTPPRRVMAMMLGHVHVCEGCLRSGAVERRRRRNRTRRKGQFIASQEL